MKFAVLLFLVVSTNAQDFPPCSVCGEGMAITNEDALVLFPTQTEPVACLDLEVGGQQGFVEERFCALIPALIEDCGCMPGEPQTETRPPNGPTGPTPPAPTPQPVQPPAVVYIPGEDFPPCSVCGDGLAITDEEALLLFPGESDPIGCLELEIGGQQGFIDPASCALIPSLITVCDCMPGDPQTGTEPPVDPTPSPTPQPVPSAPPPTPAPRTNPTKAPTPAPVPRANPTRVPTPSPTPEPPTRPAGRPDCNICGDGAIVRENRLEIDFEGEDTTCGELFLSGLTGGIPRRLCRQFPNYISEECRCEAVGGLPPSPPPMSVPVYSPPTRMPASPTRAPTRAPTKAPTRQPTPPPTRVPSNNGYTPVRLVKPIRKCSNKNKCELCEGDCNKDSDCKGRLVCFQKGRGKESDGDNVPGCIGNDLSRTDWCVDPDERRKWEEYR